MWTGRVPSRSDRSHRIALLHLVADLDLERREVCVIGLDTVGVADPDQVPVAAVHSDEDDCPLRRGKGGVPTGAAMSWPVWKSTMPIVGEIRGPNSDVRV